MVFRLGLVQGLFVLKWFLFKVLRSLQIFLEFV